MDPDVADGGPKLVGRLGAAAPRSAILILNSGEEPGKAAALFRAGARGYLRKDCDLEQVVGAIEQVARGEVVVGHLVADTFLADISDDGEGAAQSKVLTPRELDVLKLIATGMTNSAIAGELFITEHTVKGHLGRILDKLGLENRVQLAAYAVQARIPVSRAQATLGRPNRSSTATPSIGGSPIRPLASSG
jgi:DNA-binding NarL/FixJ family response regulator